MKQHILHFLFLFTVMAGMWTLTEYADDNYLSEAEITYSLGLGLVVAIASVTASIGIRWWEQRRNA